MSRVLAFLLAFVLPVSGSGAELRPGDIPAIARDGVLLVPVRAVREAFGGRLRWTGDSRSVELAAGGRSVCVLHRDDGSATAKGGSIGSVMIDGEPWVALPQLAAALNMRTAGDGDPTLELDGVSAAVRVRADDPLQPGPPSATVTLEAGRYNPLTEASERTSVELDPATTAVVVIDFWDFGDQDDPFHDNTAALVRLARRHGMHVMHVPHGFSRGLNPRVLPVPPEESIVRSNELLETHFKRKNLRIQTLLYAGYASGECVLFTRYNSLNRVARRNNPFRFILMRDASSATYWVHQFAVNGVGTRHLTSTVDDVAIALADPSRARPAMVPPDYPPVPYAVDETFGTDTDWTRTLLVVINPWECDGDDEWLKRAKANTRQNLVPLVELARARGMNVSYVLNGRQMDSALQRQEGEAAFTSLDELRDYVEQRQIRTVVYAGNLENSSTLFPAIDVWQFASDAGLPPSVRTRILADAVIVPETPQSLPEQRFLAVFLERATYAGGSRYQATTSSIMRCSGECAPGFGPRGPSD